jgi:hypothetical protein
MASLARESSDVLITGSFAAVRFVPIDPVRLVAYTMQPRVLASRLPLAAVEEDADTILLRPGDAIVFQRRRLEDGLSFAAPS